MERTLQKINREVNKEQEISDKRVLLNRDSEDKSKDSDGFIRTRYGRIMRKPDRLAYEKKCYPLFKNITHIVGSSMYNLNYLLILFNL